MPSRLPVTPLVVASSLALGSSAVAQLNPIANLIVQTQPDPVPRLVIPTGSQIVTLPGGTQQVMQTEQVWKPVCSNKASVSKLDLMAMAASHAADFADPTGAQIIDHAPAPRAGMDASDSIQSSLPAGSTIPVRYSTSSTTNETRIFWTFANFKASGGSVAGNDASMTYSTAFPFDFDPSNGVSANTISLVDVIIHETGHSMGFGSGVDFRNRDIETHDIFRFRVTDGNADFNPDSAAEFTVRPRWAVRNNPNDDVQFDTISGVEYRLSDGSPWQASHWREQVPAIGIMDPAFNYAETFYPTFLRASDLTAFDAIGWDK